MNLHPANHCITCIVAFHYHSHFKIIALKNLDRQYQRLRFSFYTGFFIINSKIICTDVLIFLLVAIISYHRSHQHHALPLHKNVTEPRSENLKQYLFREGGNSTAPTSLPLPSVPNIQNSFNVLLSKPSIHK